MSDHGDLKKALKEHGYKLVGSGKHLVYADPDGHEVRLHLGDKMRESAFRTRMKDIQEAWLHTGKKETPKGESLPTWIKEDPKCYILMRLDKYGMRQELGRCEQVTRHWFPSTRKTQARGDLFFATLVEAKAWVELDQEIP